MGANDFDVIVVGAGMAGLCCAGELVTQGLRPLLVCESAEVGALYEPAWIGKNRGIMHQPTRQASWGGGWWYDLVRRLNVNVRMYSSYREWRVMIKGTGVENDIPNVCSAAGLAESVLRLAPMPLDELRPEMERVFGAALAIPYQELVQMQHVSMGEWLEDQRADALVTMMLLTLGGSLVELDAEMAKTNLSVFGCIGMLRTYMCGEGEPWAIFPDVREGLCIPLAQAIEARGGEVWRGRKVAKVVTDGGRVGAVVLADGTEVSAPIVALASGNPRIGKLLDPLPPEVQTTLDAEAALPNFHAFEVLALLDRPIDRDPSKVLCLVNPDGSSAQVTWSLQQVAPWTTEEGKYLMFAEQFLTDKEIADAGGDEAVYGNVVALAEEMNPGYTDAIVETTRMRHPSWMSPFLTTPKLPRTTESVDGLWFVGEGSTPVGGMYMETSASAGILGARGIAAVRR